MRQLRCYAKAYALCVGVFVTLLLLVSLMPRASIQKQLERSADALLEEGDYPQAWPTATFRADSLDNFSTALSLNVVAHAVGNFPTGAFSDAYYAGEGSMTEQYDRGLDEPAQVSYSRYWHGYIAVFALLLLVFNINQIRVLFLTTTIVLSCIAMALLGRKVRTGAALSLGLSLFFANVWVAAVSTSLSFVFIVALAATVLVLVHSRDDAEELGEDVGSVTFFVLGAVTVFLDFLTTPLVTLGLPLATYLVLHRSLIARLSLKKTLAFVACSLVAWGAGYALVWVSKWLIALILFGPQALADIAALFGQWTTSASIDGVQVTRLGAVIANVRAIFPTWMLLALVALAVLWTALLIPFRKRETAKLTAALAVVLILPLAWYFVLSGHSTHHAFFTYRSLVVALYSAGLIVTFALDWDALGKACAQSYRRIRSHGA